MSEYDNKLIREDNEYVYFGNILNSKGRYDLAHLWGDEGIVAISVDNSTSLTFAPNMSIQTGRAINSFQNTKTAVTAEPLSFSITFACVKWGDSIRRSNTLYNLSNDNKYVDSLSRSGNNELNIKQLEEVYYPCEWTEEKLKQVFEIFNVTDYTPLVFGKHWYDKEFDENTEFDGDNSIERGFENPYYLDNTDRSYLRHIYKGIPEEIEEEIDGEVVTKIKRGIYSYYKNEVNVLSSNDTKGGYTPIYYNVIPYVGSLSELVLNAHNNGYITIPFVCDAPHAWQLEYRKYLVSREATPENEINFNLFNLCNFKDKSRTYRAYPYMRILEVGVIGGNEPAATDKIGFKLSQLDDNSYMYINDLSEIKGSNERLIIDCNNSQIYNNTTNESYLKHLVNKDNETYINFLYLEPTIQETTDSVIKADFETLESAENEQRENGYISEETKAAIDEINERGNLETNPFYHILGSNVYYISSNNKIILAINILSAIITAQKDKRISYRENFWNTINVDNSNKDSESSNTSHGLAFTVEFYVPCACMNQLQ